MSKMYQGTAAGAVTVDGKPLNPRLDLRSHSPAGFNWGYNGSGPAQLSLALLADHLAGRGPEGLELAQTWYQPFKFRVIGRLPQAQPWAMSSEDIEAHLQSLMNDFKPEAA